MTYSIDFRKKVLEIKRKENLSIRKTSSRFGICNATIVKWIKDITIKTSRNKQATKINMEALSEDVKRYPDSYMYERAKRLGVSKNGIWHALKRLNVTYKKNSKSSQKNRRRQIYLPRENQDIQRTR
jgi:transposase